TYAFIKERTFEELTPVEIAELDSLAELIARGAAPRDLADFYRTCERLRLESVEADPYSLVAGAGASTGASTGAGTVR
ncbi:MAG: hypothetical protein HKN20_15795, partial [Gemmatimonadetes bacterium]|nr:hypothetical protein [Gemmatimonadota bacterium]